MRKGRDLRFTHSQVIDVCSPGEGCGCLWIRLLNLAVIAGGVLGTGVLPAFVTVGGVVLGDAVDVGELHVPIFQHGPGTVRGNGFPTATRPLARVCDDEPAPADDGDDEREAAR